MRALGVLTDDGVHVADPAQANRLYNKGFFGVPETGNSLALSIAEAAYLIEVDRLQVDGHDAATMLANAPEGAEARYLAYRDLRERGLVVRPSGTALTAWARGDGPNKEPWFTTQPFAERTPITVADLQGEADTVSIVDEDGQVTHYSVQAIAPQGSVPEQPVPDGAATILGDHVYVSDAAMAQSLAEQWLGSPHGDGRLLSFVEAAHLGGALNLGNDFVDVARKMQPQFDAVRPVHDALRSAGVVTRSGFRFGTHLRGYSGNPDEGHAPWLIHCVTATQNLPWSSISRGVRLAHGVRKQFVLGWGPEPVQFLAMEWFRP